MSGDVFKRGQRAGLVLIGNIGDLLLLEPAIRFLHERGLEIDLFCTAETAMVWRDDPRLRKVVPIRSSNQKYSSREEEHASAALPKERYDHLFDFWPTGRSVKISWRLRSKGKATWTGLGAKRWLRALVYSRRVDFPGLDIKRADVYLRLLELDEPEIQALLPARMTVPAEEIGALQKKHAAAMGKFLVVQPTARWQRKLWPVEQWRAMIARLLQETPFQLRLVAGPVEEERQYLNAVAEGLIAPEHLFAGNLEWRELVALIAVSAGFVGLDSAPYHAAAMLGKPLVVLFGPTNEKEWGPSLARQIVVTPPPGAERKTAQIEFEQVWRACRSAFLG